MEIKIDLSSPIEERLKIINSITNISILEALLLKAPVSNDDTILKEWETTKAIIKARIIQIKENDSSTISLNIENPKNENDIKLSNKPVKKASNILALISLVITALYLLYLMSYLSSTYAAASADIQTWGGLGTAIGTAIAIRLAMPHMIVVFIAFIFNIVTAITRKGWAALTSGILYAVSILLMPIWFIFVTIQTVLCFVQFAKIKKTKERK